MKKEIAWKNFTWRWQEDDLFGDLEIDCECGIKLERDTYSTEYNDEDKLVCDKCGRIYTIQKEIKVFCEEPKIAERTGGKS